MLRRSSISIMIIFTNIFGDVYIDDIKKAKVGECYKKTVIPAKYEIKEELIEIEKPSKKIVVKNPKFKQLIKKVEITPSYIDVIDSVARFKSISKKLPIKDRKIYYTIGKSREIPLKKEFIEYVKKQKVALDTLKIGECFIEYIKTPKDKKIQKEFIKKQAYEIIDVEPPKFKIVKKKIEVKPAYSKIVKTPAIYETKNEKVLIEPAKKIFKKSKDGVICIGEKPAVYKNITKKILKTPPMTKVIKFPPTYKEIEVKVFEKPAKISRRVVPQKKESYDFFIEQQPTYFWLKEDKKTDAKPTGLRICKRESKEKYIQKKVEVVTSPATTKKVNIPAKSIDIKSEVLLSDANITEIKLPPQYEKIKTKVEISPAKIVWKRVGCTDTDSKTKAVK